MADTAAAPALRWRSQRLARIGLLPCYQAVQLLRTDGRPLLVRLRFDTTFVHSH
jgi:hypothetical protein